jgi:hypothetical protein
MMDKDHCMRKPAPVAPVATLATEGEEDPTLADCTAAETRSVGSA